jgi:isopenicillin N synthase-like dioxygenase
MLEPGAKPDTKEALYIGEDLPGDDPRVLRGEYNCGPNLFPDVLGREFKDTCMEYYYAARNLAEDVMRAIALALGLNEGYFDDILGAKAFATLRLIHYPPTPETGSKERGVGAHRDFGCITLLLQDSTGGLQVQDEKTGAWLDVQPVQSAYVVNLGNAMMRWTNHHYTSNTHRVMNFSGKDRYSAPFFYNCDVESVMRTLPGCEVQRDTGEKKFGLPAGEGVYLPVVLREFLNGQFEESYARVSPLKS